MTDHPTMEEPMTATTTKPRTIRQRKAALPPDLSRLGSFPPPTAISEELAVANLDLASDQARQFCWACNLVGLLPDLEAVAWTGLLNACRRYDPERLNPANGKPYHLSTIAVCFIRGAMFRYLRDKGFAVKFPYEWREAAPHARRLLMEGESLEQIAAGLRMNPVDVGRMLHDMGPTSEIEDELFQPKELAEEKDDNGKQLLATEWTLALAAFDDLDDDSLLLKAWWDDEKRRRIPSGPKQRFLRRVYRIRRHLPREETSEQLSLMSPEVLTQRASELGLET